jgi:branched-subunit amino acid aminotransferase/4-amino-4-deoxychorismate lyase
VSVGAPWWDSKDALGTKHGAWQPYLDAMGSARDAGVYCALLVCPDGYVVDGDRVTPLMWDAAGRLRYPPPSHGSVESVTMQLIMKELPNLIMENEGAYRGFPTEVEADRFTLNDLMEAREVVLLGSGLGVGRLTSVDGEALGGHAVPTGQAEAEDGAKSGTEGSLLSGLSKCLARARETGWLDIRRDFEAVEAISS